jgi:fumarylpyruvate hydrolase
MTTYLFNPPAIPSLPIQGRDERFPINRLFFVGRNYHAHAVEMGKPVDKSVERPFYFTKAPQTLTESGATVAYPPETQNYHFEMELVVAIGKPGFRVKVEDAHTVIYGYAAGLDMTRRDLQNVFKDKRLSWDLGKDFENSAVFAPLTRGFRVGHQRIQLSVNGTLRQDSHLDDMIWPVGELLAHLSQYYHLGPGDLVLTGTPAGVGPVVAGDEITGGIDGLAPISLRIAAAE